jgi:hypothetical protein
VAVLVADTAILSVDDKFRLLVSRDLPRHFNSLSLRPMYRGSPLIASAFDGPPASVRNDMLILTGHNGSPTVETSKSQPSDWVVNWLLLQHNALLAQTTV